MKTSIKVENLSKKFTIGNSVRPSLKDTFHQAWLEVLNPKKQEIISSDELWALKDITFSIQEGEAVGIIGKNGVGKSTLLKILARLTEPTSGRAELTGRVTSLLELGTGFHPDLTGRENIYLNGAFLGMKRREVVKVLDRIVSFSEIEKFLETPVKRYSSGMILRLAIGVALHLNSDILLLDEVMEVLDSAFKLKCFQRLREKKKEGGTILLVSHDEDSFKGFCDELIHLQSGQLLEKNIVEKVLENYRKELII